MGRRGKASSAAGRGASGGPSQKPDPPKPAPSDDAKEAAADAKKPDPRADPTKYFIGGADNAASVLDLWRSLPLSAVRELTAVKECHIYSYVEEFLLSAGQQAPDVDYSGVSIPAEEVKQGQLLFLQAMMLGEGGIPKAYLEDKMVPTCVVKLLEQGLLRRLAITNTQTGVWALILFAAWQVQGLLGYGLFALALLVALSARTAPIRLGIVHAIDYVVRDDLLADSVTHKARCYFSSVLLVIALWGSRMLPWCAVLVAVPWVFLAVRDLERFRTPGFKLAWMVSRTVCRVVLAIIVVYQWWPSLIGIALTVALLLTEITIPLFGLCLVGGTFVVVAMSALPNLVLGPARVAKLVSKHNKRPLTYGLLYTAVAGLVLYLVWGFNGILSLPLRALVVYSWFQTLPTAFADLVIVGGVGVVGLAAAAVLGGWRFAKKFWKRARRCQWRAPPAAEDSATYSDSD